jgi:uncharacterized coiled-coil protein SlyX
MTDTDKLDLILELLGKQEKVLDSHSKSFDLMHERMGHYDVALGGMNAALAQHVVFSERILSRLDALFQRVEDVENRLTRT